MDLLQVCSFLAAVCCALAMPPRGHQKRGPSRRAYPPPRTARSSLVYALTPPQRPHYQHVDSPTFTITQDQYLSALQSLSAAKLPSPQDQPEVEQTHRLLLPTPHPVHEEQHEPEHDHAAALEPAAPVPEPISLHEVHSVQQLPANHKSVYSELVGEPSDYAAKYQFGYHVRDPKHGSFFGHSEARDGHRTKGHYHVLLPDGRLQNVQYWADPSGYHAQVSYDGAARHYQ